MKWYRIDYFVRKNGVTHSGKGDIFASDESAAREVFNQKAKEDVAVSSAAISHVRELRCELTVQQMAVVVQHHSEKFVNTQSGLMKTTDTGILMPA